jgi:hypothetical protein
VTTLKGRSSGPQRQLPGREERSETQDASYPCHAPLLLWSSPRWGYLPSTLLLLLLLLSPTYSCQVLLSLPLLCLQATLLVWLRGAHSSRRLGLLLSRPAAENGICWCCCVSTCTCLHATTPLLLDPPHVMQQQVWGSYEQQVVCAPEGWAELNTVLAQPNVTCHLLGQRQCCNC